MHLGQKKPRIKGLSTIPFLLLILSCSGGSLIVVRSSVVCHIVSAIFHICILSAIYIFVDNIVNYISVAGSKNLRDVGERRKIMKSS